MASMCRFLSKLRLIWMKLQCSKWLKLCCRSKMDGAIATNTTLDKSAVQHLKYGNEMGGLSGLPVQQKSTEIIRQFRAAAPWPTRCQLLG